MSESTSTESFELINDLNNDQKNTLISPSLSSTSTDCIEDLSQEELFRMESEFKEKLDISNVSNITESSTIEHKIAAQQQQQQTQSNENISESIKFSNSGDHHLMDEFDNKRLQEQLNIQIQSNQEHLQTNQQQQKYEQPPALQQQLNSQQLQEMNRKLQQQMHPATQQQSALEQVNLLSNQAPQNTQQQAKTTPHQANNPTNTNSSTEIAKVASPLTSSFPDPSSLFGWFSKQDFINKVAENAVNGFNSVLITLDPQMKEIRPGGPSILVTSNHPFDITYVRDGFLDVFKRATVKSIETFLQVETAIQLVGISTAHKISLERIKGLRSNISIVPQNQIIVTLENFLYNFDERWFESDYILLDDPLNKIELSVHTQGIPIEEKYVKQLKAKANHKFRDDGFSIRLDSLIASDLNCSIGDWLKEYAGIDKSTLHYQAVLLLSNLYKNKLKAIGRLNE